MSIKEQIERDLKQALLAGDKELVTTLRGLKSAILNAEIAKNVRDKGLSDEEVTELLSKEAKKRQESADLYKQGGSNDRAEKELAEKKVIERYLPEQLSDEEVAKEVEEAIKETGANSMQQMGQVISKVRESTKGQADGGTIARIVKEKLQ